jgi:hypothetical protein
LCGSAALGVVAARKNASSHCRDRGRDRIPARFRIHRRFSAYIYLLHHVRPALATSYAYVNPPIAVLIGVCSPVNVARSIWSAWR